jgi:hypothetical protein
MNGASKRHVVTRCFSFMAKDVKKEQYDLDIPSLCDIAKFRNQ